ncbi:MAG: type I-U CRISPR-associated protein Csb2 [Candidatus Methylomirabilota bacterium]
MLAIQLQFLAGRYHATPWGRNVNEGAVEWPPSPYRLARALVDICRRRRPEWPDERLEAALVPLAAPVAFQLPAATAAHVRSFLSSNTLDPTEKQKIVDAFVVLDPQSSVVAAFDCEPDPTVRGDLAALLDEMSYLGRCESWVSARIVPMAGRDGVNCLPAPAASGGPITNRVPVACVRLPEDYVDTTSSRVPGKRRASKTGAVRPMSWVGALSLSTTDLLDQGWSVPPAQRIVDYLLPEATFAPPCEVRQAQRSPQVSVARYALHSTVLPRTVETVPFAERIRVHLMGIHRRVVRGDLAAVSPRFSGKDRLGRPATGHAHAFILPLDEDGDGRIDHLEVRVGTPFEQSELEALDRLRSVWQSDGRPDVELVLIGLTRTPSARVSKTWASATPFVTSRHYRRGRGAYREWIGMEIRRECEIHGLPAPAQIQWVDHASGRGHALRWAEFVRSRKGKPPLRGHGCILTFSEPARGPFALGALCHYGLGLFMPCNECEQ